MRDALASHPHEDDWEGDPPVASAVQRAGLIAGALLFAAMRLAAAPEGLSAEAWAVAATGVLMAIWWMTEALPLAVTSLVPIVALPLTGAQAVGATTQAYGHPFIFLFLGGFVIAIAMERWNLHRRVALAVIRTLGTQPRRIVLGFLLSAALLSMWVSNTATAVMMLPIGASVVALARRSGEGTDGSEHQPAFATALMLAIAYGCSIGGLGTLIGTPTNAILAGFAAETYGFEIGFDTWLLVGLPLVAVGLPVAHVLLTRVAFPIRMSTLPGGRALIEREWAGLGPMSTPERRVLVVFACVALLWVLRTRLAPWLPDLHDATIAIAGAAALFAIPSGGGRALLTWREAERLPWGVLLIFGGGLALAGAIAQTGLAAWIGQSLGGLGRLPLWTLVLAVVVVIVFLTELTSNVATAAAFLPILASVAIGIGENPLLLIVPAAVASSCAFMLPVATPPNAIVYGSGAVTMPQMLRAGLLLNLAFVGVVLGLALGLVPLVFGIEAGVLPGWAAPSAAP
jgi:sodium-dependent dicarboxylate transporter 2/3/5